MVKDLNMVDCCEEEDFFPNFISKFDDNLLEIWEMSKYLNEVLKDSVIGEKGSSNWACSCLNDVRILSNKTTPVCNIL